MAVLLAMTGGTAHAVVYELEGVVVTATKWQSLRKSAGQYICGNGKGN